MDDEKEKDILLFVLTKMICANLLSECASCEHSKSIKVKVFYLD